MPPDKKPFLFTNLNKKREKKGTPSGNTKEMIKKRRRFME